MAFTLVHNHIHSSCFYSAHSSFSFCLQIWSRSSAVKAGLSCRARCSRIRLRKLPRASGNTNPSNNPEKPKLKPRVSDGCVNPDPVPEQNSRVSLLHRLRETFKLDGLGMDILSIALPAALALAADPITSLVDTAFVGHLGSAELAAVGVSGAVFNLVSKLFNVPLLNVTTSFVAEEQASLQGDFDVHRGNGKDSDPKGKMFLPSVSSAVILAATLGIVEAAALFTGSCNLMNTMGIPVDSSIRLPAEQFLTLRAIGAPAIVIALAAQGTFRGFKDTKTPLFAVGAGNLLNAILDPVLIFYFGLGVGGAAISTVISEYLICLILLLKLNDKVQLIAPNFNTQRISQYLASGALLTGRTVAVLLTTTIATSMAAREGPIKMAGYQICFQVWLALSLLNDALALAGQTIIASDYSQGNYEPAGKVAYKVLQIGLAVGLALAIILSLGFDALSGFFTTDSEVLEVARSGVLFVAGSQPVNAVAFVLDGLYYGVSDFGFAAYSMVIVGLISSLFLAFVAPHFGLAGVWCGLFLFMTLRVLAGVVRLGTRSGPWRLLWLDTKNEND